MIEEPYKRNTICVGCSEPDVVIHEGHDSFRPKLKSLYVPDESLAIEQMVGLKSALQDCTSSTDFYNILSQGLTSILDAQFLFVSKRILQGDEKFAVEMPPIGEPGSCLMALLFYYNNGHGIEGDTRDVTYHAYECPCAYMRHEKIFLVPDKLSDFVPNNPNTLPFPSDAYLGVPLFFQGKCIAHFGLMWSPEGNTSRKLGWGVIELICHALEDLILRQVLKSTDYGKIQPEVNVIPYHAVDSNQTSLKTYARCLSHELRTPMHGVVGMLDVMYATVQEAVESDANRADKQLLQTLKDNIELVQVSSRRAVEAADNVVQACDLGMGRAEAPELETNVPLEPVARPMASPLQGKKRRSSWNMQDHPAKHQAPDRELSDERTLRLANAVEEASRVTRVRWSDDIGDQNDLSNREQLPNGLPSSTSSGASISTDHSPAYSNIRDLIDYVIRESLRTGKAYDSATAKEVEGGQIIDVVARVGTEHRKTTIEWTVDSSVPEIVRIEERDLAKLVSCVFQNALKFTDAGRVTLKATASLKDLYIRISDTGPGIPDSFRPKIFQPFSREDHTITRQNEGLGLGLLVAKGLSRKLKGDLNLIRCSTDNTDHGSEFEIRIACVENSRDASPESPMALSAPQSPHISKAAKTRASEASTSYLPVIPTVPQSTLLGGAVKPVLSRKVSKSSEQSYTKNLASSHPLTFLVAEDNTISRKILVNMLGKLGYNPKTQIYEVADGSEAVQQVAAALGTPAPVELILMDLWMPSMDGYEASERILGMYGAYHRQPMAKRSFSEPDGLSMAKSGALGQPPTIFAVTADTTDGAAQRAIKSGMEGFMIKPFKIKDLEKLIRDGWARRKQNLVNPLHNSDGRWSI